MKDNRVTILILWNLPNSTFFLSQKGYSMKHHSSLPTSTSQIQSFISSFPTPLEWSKITLLSELRFSKQYPGWMLSGNFSFCHTHSLSQNFQRQRTQKLGCCLAMGKIKNSISSEVKVTISIYYVAATAIIQMWSLKSRFWEVVRAEKERVGIVQNLWRWNKNSDWLDMEGSWKEKAKLPSRLRLKWAKVG